MLIKESVQIFADRKGMFGSTTSDSTRAMVTINNTENQVKNRMNFAWFFVLKLQKNIYSNTIWSNMIDFFKNHEIL